jgi:indole-3-glycerol phosphate synthase
VGVLDRILATKQQEILSLRNQRLPAPPKRRWVELARPADRPLSIIAEIKRRSPSAGPLSTRLGVGERARVYERAGARMVSVLCDPTFFDGALQDLEQARDSCELPLLCKDFVIDEVQLDAARAWGADAVLLIARCVSANRLHVLWESAVERDLVPLVEIATEGEAELAVSLGASLVGVNARDLDTLAMDLDRAAHVLGSLPPGVTAVHLSGVSSPGQVAGVARSRADAVLVGEALMRQDDPEPLLRQMVEAADPASAWNLSHDP